MLFGDNSILQKATDAKVKTEKAQIIENTQTKILGQQAENKGANITKGQLAEILNTYFKPTAEASIPDEVSSEVGHDIELTTKDEKYTIKLSEIYSGNLKKEIVEPGLYNADTGELIYTWDKLIELGNMININSGKLSRGSFNVPSDVEKVKLVIIDDGSVTSIGGMQGISKLTEIIIPNTVTSIGNSAFAGNSGLTSISLPDSVVDIESGIFAGCANLASVKLSNNISNIPDSAFGGDSNLESIEIPNSVTTISRAAFGGCTKLTSIYIPSNVTTISAIDDLNTPFSACSASLKIYCEVSEANKPSGWGTYWNYYQQNGTLDVVWRKNQK